MNLHTIEGVLVPPDESQLWRYMSYHRFEQLITTKKIYFSRIDKFSDFSEGSMTRAMERSEAENMVAQGVPDLTGIMAWFNRFLNQKYWYASCWNQSDKESNLLWRSYGQPREEDEHKFKIAIKTNVSKLTSSIDIENLYIGNVNYYDFDKEDPFEGLNGIPNGSLVYSKQHEYHGEKEIRLAYQETNLMEGGIIGDLPETPEGIAFNVDLDTLIDKIYIEAVPIDHTKANDPVYVESIKALVHSRFELIQNLLEQNKITDKELVLSMIL